MAKSLGIAGDLDGAELLTAVCKRIEAEPCWLLVLDNADDLGLFGVGETAQRERQGQTAGKALNLYDFVPRGPVRTVLWTSRDRRIGGSLVGAQRAINVARMTDDEAAKLLEVVGNRKISEDERGIAAQLLQELGWLPLAVSQGTGGMTKRALLKISPSGYHGLVSGTTTGALEGVWEIRRTRTASGRMGRIVQSRDRSISAFNSGIGLPIPQRAMERAGASRRGDIRISTEKSW